MKHSILRDTIFKPNPDGNGGEHRTAQIDELIRLAEIDIEDIDRSLPFSATNKWQRYRKAFLLLNQDKFSISLNRQKLASVGYLYAKYLDGLNQYQGEKILLWEATRDENYIAPYVAKKAGFKIIAMPQNLESLAEKSKDCFNEDLFPQTFLTEIKHLQQADYVFCISREEQWLLKLFDIKAEYLPYYPPKLLEKKLLKIRKKRQETNKKNFLILGSVTNKPTRLGVIELINLLNQINQKIDIEIDIAGYGTETLAEYCNNSNCKLHGSVTPEQLIKLQETTKAIIVHQIAASGVLTRIPEMLIAGIPVIGNSIACRSSFGYSGVYCYDNMAELQKLLTDDFHIPDILPRPVNYEQNFVNCLKQLAIK